MKKTLTIFFLLLNYGLFSQVVELYSNNFESGTPLSYTYSPVVPANTWRISTCAGNGTSAAGTNALYVSKGGVNPGCGADGEDQYAFNPAPPSATERIIAYTSIDGSCTNSHVISFDYKLNPAHSSNIGFVVYSTNGGLFWDEDTLPNATDWTSVSINLNGATNNTTFLVGFRFNYSNVNGDGDPFAIDNITVSGNSAGANIQLDTLAVCGQTTAVITADGNISGTGQWTLVSGQGNLNNPSAPETGVNNLGIGTNIFAWTVTSGTCGNSSDTLVVINSLAPSFANVQDTVYACAVDQLNISTSPPMAGTGLWTAPQGATIANPSSPATLVTNIPEGWSQLVWTVSAPGCPSNADTMNVFTTGGQAILQADTNICFGTDPLLLINTTPTDSLQSIEWLFAVGNGLINVISDNSIELSGLQTGENQLIYEVTHSLCPKESDTLRIYITPCEDFEPVFPTVITPNGDGKNDLFVVHNLEKIYPNCQMTIFNRLGNVVYESVGYEIPWDGTYKGEKLPMGTYFFKLELNDNENTVYNGPINIIH